MTKWEEEIVLPKKELDIEYAYIRNSDLNPIRCDKETLLDIIENDKDLKFVATPQSETYIIPGTDYETLKPILKKNKSSIKNSLYWALGYTIFFGGLTFLYTRDSEEGFFSDRSGVFFLLVFGIIPILDSLYELFAIRKVNDSNYQKECSQLKFDFWIHQETVISIFIFTGTLILITIIQLIYGLGDSIESIGLVKTKVFEGEYWRLLTSILAHGGIFHIFFNATATFIIGKMVIRITGFSNFTIVFLFSGILGSIFSLYLILDQTSVGASGGIMGLIGFLLVLSIKFNDNIPRNIVKSMLNTIIVVAIIGFSASDIIDNAAHGGGLIGGIFIGLLLIRKKNNTIPYKSNLLIKIFGVVSTLILIYGIIIIIKQL